MLEGILWDNDGVLVDTERLYYQANVEVLSSEGVTLELADYTRLFLERNKGAWDLLRERGASEEEVERLREERNNRYQQLLQTEEIRLPGAEEVLKLLYRKVRMGVVTSSRREHFETIHRRTGFEKYFEFSITSDDCPLTKPHPQPYLLGLRKLGVSREECLVIEDSVRGLEAALEAKICCWVIPTELTRSSDFSLAERVLDSISEVPGLVRELHCRPSEG